MTIQPGIFIADWSLACALGEDRARVEARLFSPNPPGLTATASLDGGRIVPAGRLGFPLPALPDSLAAWDSANNRLILHCLQALNPAIEQAKAQFGAHRLGVVLGSSTSGIASTESALRHRLAHGDWPASFTLGRWELGDPAAFAYMENWPITVTQARSNSEAEFNQDIVLRFKASERGVPAVMEPRRIQRNRAMSTSSSGE